MLSIQLQYSKFHGSFMLLQTVGWWLENCKLVIIYLHFIFKIINEKLLVAAGISTIFTYFDDAHHSHSQFKDDPEFSNLPKNEVLISHSDCKSHLTGSLM